MSRRNLSWEDTAMPKPNPGESESSFVDRCIPVVMHEGTAKHNKQAAAICHSMWREAEGHRKARAYRDQRDRRPE